MFTFITCMIGTYVIHRSCAVLPVARKSCVHYVHSSSDSIREAVSAAKNSSTCCESTRMCMYLQQLFSQKLSPKNCRCVQYKVPWSFHLSPVACCSYCALYIDLKQREIRRTLIATPFSPPIAHITITAFCCTTSYSPRSAAPYQKRFDRVEVLLVFKRGGGSPRDRGLPVTRVKPFRS